MRPLSPALLLCLLLDISSCLCYSSYYIHIPFCRKRCSYCDFPISPTGHNVNADLKSRYLKFLHNEIERNRLKHGVDATDLDAMYIGGGTPSLLPASDLTFLVDLVRSGHRFSQGAEITVEMDPGTFDSEKLRRLTDAGVNRVSLGVQSFDDRMLEAIGRVHRRDDVMRSIDIVEGNADVGSWSMDLMSGLPGLTKDGWYDALSVAAGVKPPHLSCYDLQLEKGTNFGRRFRGGVDRRGELGDLPSDEECADMYRMTSEVLGKVGYEHYEVSSYALQGQRSKHNGLYWGYKASWLAAGCGASSCENGMRVTRPREIADYADWVEAGMVDLGGDEVEPLEDWLMTALRTSDGVDLNFVQQEFGGDVLRKVLKGSEFFEEKGLCRRDGGRLMLSDPDGFLFSNEVLSSIFVHLD